jgi:hypothetical protein
MSFCEHCQGQRFDRARVLRALRQLREDLRAAQGGGKVDGAMRKALHAVKALDIPHLEADDDYDDEVVH